ncbi:capsid staple protein [Proteus mirabilis]|uniref:capsid staple protein n=1 Tax=Proteus mirabilis TaxID=584 RepID=UPI003A9294A7
MKLINLKTSTETYENAKGEKETREEYPYGLRISLENDTKSTADVLFDGGE